MVLRVRNVRELGLLLRQRRRDQGWSQQELATRIGASRHWVIGVETGKATAEIGLVFKALSALGLVCDVRRGGPAGLHRSAAAHVSSRASPPSTTSLEGVLRRAHGGRLSAPETWRKDPPGGARDVLDVPVPDLARLLGRMTGSKKPTGGTGGPPETPSRS